MAKPAKYPKKFRQKLEAIATARDDRSPYEPKTPGKKKHPADMTGDELMAAANDLLWHQFLPSGSVDLMHAKASDDQRRLDTTVHMRLKWRPEYVGAAAPWLSPDQIAEYEADFNTMVDSAADRFAARIMALEDGTIETATPSSP